jgi:hypothetical protein
MFTFDEKNHLYTLNGKPLTGATTILGVIAKPSLIQWSATMACDFVKDNLKAMEDLEKVLKEARVAHRKKKEKAGDIGTAVHKACEDWIKTKKIPTELSVEGLKMFSNFVAWSESEEVEFLESEVRVYSEKYWYAGTCDLVLRINGHVYIGDIKTSMGIYPEAFYQTSAYQLALNEMGLYPKVKGHVIINLRKDGKMETQYSEDYAEDKKAFLGALAIYRRQNNVKNK